MSPRVSVIMATYDYGPYIAQSIRSVLDQTFSDFELLIVDDGSRDGTPSIVEQFEDPRITFWVGAENRGSAARRNELIARSHGEYIAVQNSDDLWPPDKLAHQVEFLDGHPEYAATFGRAVFVDAEGAPLWTGAPSPFDQPNRSSALWLRRFFMGENPLCHPTIMLRRRCHEEAGDYDIRLRQRIDIDMWIRLLKRYRLFVSDKTLVSLRWHGRNVSDTNADDARARWLNEHYLIAESFFDGMSDELFVEGFGDLLQSKSPPPTREHREIEEALLHLRCRSSVGAVNRVVGLRRLYALLASPRHRPVLVRDYGIDHIALHRLSGEMETFRQAVVDLPAAAEQRTELAARLAAVGEYAALASEHAALLESASWRLTAPLRWAGRVIRDAGRSRSPRRGRGSASGS